MSDLFASLRALNAAAYAAQAAGHDTTEHPMLNRQMLREICHATDKLVDDNAPTITPRALDHGAPLTGGQVSARTTSPAGPFSFPDAAPTHGHAAVTGGGNPPKAAAGDINQRAPSAPAQESE